jgi:hypothetical protein
MVARGKRRNRSNSVQEKPFDAITGRLLFLYPRKDRSFRFSFPGGTGIKPVYPAQSPFCGSEPEVPDRIRRGVPRGIALRQPFLPPRSALNIPRVKRGGMAAGDGSEFIPTGKTFFRDQ